MTEEYTELIASRVPPGDNWTLAGDSKQEVVTGLVNTLNAYVRKNGFKGDYRLSPLSGKLYAIKEREAKEPEPQTFDLYGEF